MKKVKFALYIIAILFATVTLAVMLNGCSQKTHVHKSGYYVVDSVLIREKGTTTVKLKGIENPVLFLSDTIKLKDTLYMKKLRAYSKKINAYNLY
jgi:hypothetical protein